ncbi:uncharacterized protein METZ01_LOCUS179094, partial [marine metagenome]
VNKNIIFETANMFQRPIYTVNTQKKQLGINYAIKL